MGVLLIEGHAARAAVPEELFARLVVARDY
jgi:hypothetical protein